MWTVTAPSGLGVTIESLTNEQRETFLIGKEIKNKPTKLYCLEIDSAKCLGKQVEFCPLHPQITPKVWEKFNKDEQTVEWLQYKEKSHL